MNAASDVTSGRFVGPIVSDEHAKVGDPCTNRSREIPPKPSEAAFRRFFRDNFLCLSGEPVPSPEERRVGVRKGIRP